MKTLRILLFSFCFLGLPATGSAGETPLIQWTGGAKAGVMPVSDAGPSAAGTDPAGGEDRKDGTLESLAKTVLTVGREYDPESFNPIARAARIPEENSKSRLRVVALAKGDYVRTLLVRQRALPEQIDVVMMFGPRNTYSVYISSAQGTLARALRYTDATKYQPVNLRDAREPYQRERNFWQKWEERYHRTGLTDDEVQTENK